MNIKIKVEFIFIIYQKYLLVNIQFINQEDEFYLQNLKNLFMHHLVMMEI